MRASAADIRDLQRRIDPAATGEAIHALIRGLYPICRSITGDGVRRTLARIGEQMPLEIHEVPTGTPVFDWTVPKEWNIRDAYIRRSDGTKVVDFNDSNLHVLGYSTPVEKTLPLSELREHLHSIPERPDWIPYKTSYYAERWGFCLPHRRLAALADGLYEVRIDSTLADGHLTYAECFIPGRTSEEVLLSCHVCHPSLCNDNLSGVALCAFLAKHLGECALRYSYRFLFIPGTIGAITWLALNEERARRIRHGLVVACVGDPGKFTYKKSRRGDAEIDGAAVRALKDAGDPFCVRDFSPDGYDERQFCSPGFDLPVGSLTRTPHGEYPEYHTSADDLDLVKPAALADSFSKYLAVLGILETNEVYLNQSPKCEPQLGRRGLYREIGGRAESDDMEKAVLWVLNLSDGGRSLLDISERAGLRFETVEAAAGILVKGGLLANAAREPAGGPTTRGEPR